MVYHGSVLRRTVNAMTPTNRTLASLFSSMAELLQTGHSGTARSHVNPHRIRAYRRAAETMNVLEEDISDVAARGGLRQLAGIGRDLAAKIQEFLHTGTISSYEELRRPLPAEVRPWCNLPGLSESLVQQLYYRWGIQTLADLETLVRSHLLRSLPGPDIPEQALLDAIRQQRNGAP
jgi:DNA polymerase (family X)